MQKHFFQVIQFSIIILLAMFARLYHLQTQSIWFDEGWSAYAAVQPTLVGAVEADPTNPPLYYVTLNLLARGFGDSAFALRYVSLLFGLLIIPLAYHLARHLFDLRAALGAAFLTAFSPLLWWASQEARMYTLLAVLVLIVVWGWHRLLHQSSPGAWIALWLGELALLYAHNTGPIIVVWLNTLVVVAWIRYRSLKRPDWRIWFAGQIGVGLFWSPWFIARFLNVPGANSGFVRDFVSLPDLLGQMWQAVWTGPWAMVGKEPVLILASAGIFVLSAALIPWRKAAGRWLIAHVMILSLGLLLGIGILGGEMHGRYLVMVAPLLLVAIGAGIARWRYVLYSGLTLCAVVFVISIHLATHNPAYAHDDVRGMVQYYADHMTIADSVLAWSYADRYDLAYYWPRLNVKAHRITLPEGADLNDILPLLPRSGDVALNIWYTQRADYRGMMGCVLGDGTINLPETFTVYGMSSQLYRTPSLHPPQMLPFSLVSTAANITTLGTLLPTTADKALCLPVQITLNQPLQGNLKVVLSVRNNLGWEIARADTIFAQANQRLSSQLQPGAVLTAYPLLRLPVGTPPGDYPIFLRLYDEQFQPSGYDLTLSEQALPSKDVRIGTWQPLPGADWAHVNRDSDLPTVVNQSVSPDLTLIAHNLTDATVRNGDVLRLTLLWRGGDKLPHLTLVGDTWMVNIPPPDYPNEQTLTRDWRTVQIPPDATNGKAELRLPDGTVLARYTIDALPALYQPPPFAAPVGDTIPGVGSLIGYTLDGDSFDRRQPIKLTLVWRADQPTAVSYTVFAQLISANGQLLAQSDAIPAGGQHPTNGWRQGEYIIDTHQLIFHDDAQPSTGRLIVGMYDASTGKRILLKPGVDAITLQTNIVVR
jgi:4-amino-4-deoxy-L-arabinose transferase-like glycosyltransferase